jgi:hypothetical protein
MKTGQMLFVAVGGMLLGAGGTLAIQTGLVNYEVSLDIRPRISATVPPPNMQTRAIDPYVEPPIVQNWEPALPPVENLPLAMPPLDDQQVAEIVSLREQIGSSVSQKLTDLTGNQEAGTGEAFAEHLRAAAGTNDPTVAKPEPEVCPLCPAAESSLARGLRESHLR